MQRRRPIKKYSEGKLHFFEWEEQLTRVARLYQLEIDERDR